MRHSGQFYGFKKPSFTLHFTTMMDIVIYQKPTAVRNRPRFILCWEQARLCTFTLHRLTAL